MMPCCIIFKNYNVETVLVENYCSLLQQIWFCVFLWIDRYDLQLHHSSQPNIRKRLFSPHPEGLNSTFSNINNDFSSVCSWIYCYLNPFRSLLNATSSLKHLAHTQQFKARDILLFFKELFYIFKNCL